MIEDSSDNSRRLVQSLEESSESAVGEEFVRLFGKHHLRILAYVRSMVHDQAAAEDVFQEVCVSLWKSYPKYRADKDFSPWAFGIAHNQILKYWRKNRRDKHVFGEKLTSHLSADVIDLLESEESRRQALDDCVGRLSKRHRDLLRAFYGKNLKAGMIAEEWNCSVHAIYKALKVMRRTLFDCVERKLTSEV
ncbi:sigma-70 family RNA polymerase sigma factor [Calycomorphotria hydatis]|uniref:RNA polymerase sigma factor CarQ n=1 Tax=Calycomorphotria hydatis TaxID=2528027 RepID=A0A517T5E0_9PLAN|nr:sigma-70 family RNA polymerase sigma factor [Calycomorphotria hydatis]QDT63578.1 RNA polymerase sigma factor CarQ [Calycomorphotria hydatis]